MDKPQTIPPLFNKCCDVLLDTCLTADDSYKKTVTSVVQNTAIEERIKVWLWGKHPDALWSYQKTLEGHRFGVLALAFSPDNTMLASGSSDSTVKIWKLETGQCLRTFRGHVKDVNSVVFCSNDVIASASSDNTIKVRKLTGKLLHNLQGHIDSVRSLAVSSSNILASASTDSSIKIWNWKLGTCLKTLLGHASGVFAVVFLTPDRIVSGSRDNSIRMWDLARGECDQVVSQAHKDHVLCLAVSPHGEVASGSRDKAIKIWEINTEDNLLECISEVEHHKDAVLSLSFDPKGSTLASASYDRTIKLSDKGVSVKTIEGHTSGVQAINYSSDGELLASGSRDKTIKIWKKRDLSQSLDTMITVLAAAKIKNSAPVPPVSNILL